MEGAAKAREERGEVGQQWLAHIRNPNPTQISDINLNRVLFTESRWVIFNSLKLILISKVFTVDYIFVEIEMFDYILM